ncbi:MAG: hypothetical protein DI564_07670 [Rhodanobacter denitrificans]|uniref:DUF4426 domain-containing protein n=1 Tax=Rhodanobacter denitrificans TaxID=666685 RepID=A0A2W5KKD5_9GAMM|nr:MAG: hypothetical protein DI564_07670 [Rhodanobacter denitrificans]
MTALRLLLAASFALGGLAAMPAPAQQHETADHTILYSVLSADQLHPEVARRYGIERSDRQGLLTVIVRRKDAAAGDPAVTARIAGTVQNLLGEPRPLRLNEVRGEDTIDYLATFPLRRPDTLRFSLDVTPENGKAETVRFQREFPAD